MKFTNEVILLQITYIEEMTISTETSFNPVELNVVSQ